MTAGSLPKSLDPERAAEQRLELEGEFGPDLLPRLHECVAGEMGPVTGRLVFGRDAYGRALMEGSAQASFPLLCQRCAQVFRHQAQAHWRMVFARSAAEEQALAEHDADVCYHNGPIDVAALVEDELLLALPMAPKHPGGCEAGVPVTSHASPFAELAEMFGRAPRDK